MTALAAPAVDPLFAEVAKALYGDAVDVTELWVEKSLDSSEVHVDGNPDRKRKGLAAGLLFGASAEGLAAGRAIPAAARALREPRPLRVTGATWPKGQGLSRAKLVLRRAGSSRAGKVAEAGLQVANLAVGLGAARELTRKPKVKKPVEKAQRLRLRPLNAATLPRTPSLRARKPAGSPVAKSLTAVGEISKVDTDKRQVFGWASVSELNGEEVFDRQGDHMPVDELEKSAYRYVRECRIGGDQHARTGEVAKFVGEPKQTAELIESMVFTRDKIEKMGLPPDFPQGWWVGMQVLDEPTWELIKSGKRTGFSIHGTGRRERIDLVAKGEIRRRLRRRVEAAVHPPKVKLRPVKSSAITAMGYQPQTRRLAVEMHSRPGEPYQYRMGAGDAATALGAQSKGSHYAKKIRGQTPRATRYTAGDRARLFLHPPDSKTG